MRRLIPVLLAAALGTPVARATVTPVAVPEDLRRDYRVTLDPNTGCVSSIQAFWADPMGMGHEGCASYPIHHTDIPRRTFDFVMAHADLFKLRAGLDTLSLVEAYECLGSYYVKFEDRYRGVRVPGTWIQVRLDPRRRIEMLYARVEPNVELDPTPRLSSQWADRIATRAVDRGIPGRTVVSELEIDRRSDLVPSDTTAASDSPLLLTWPARVVTQEGKPWRVWVDAHTGEVVRKYWDMPTDPR